jgi:hypothetical protein
VHDDAVRDRPFCACRAVLDLLALGDDAGKLLRLVVEVVEESKLRPRGCDGVRGQLLLIAPGQRVGCGVLVPWTESHLDV